MIGFGLPELTAGEAAPLPLGLSAGALSVTCPDTSTAGWGVGVSDCASLVTSRSAEDGTAEEGTGGEGTSGEGTSGGGAGGSGAGGGGADMGCATGSATGGSVTGAGRTGSAFGGSTRRGAGAGSSTDIGAVIGSRGAIPPSSRGVSPPVGVELARDGRRGRPTRGNYTVGDPRGIAWCARSAREPFAQESGFAVLRFLDVRHREAHPCRGARAVLDQRRHRFARSREVASWPRRPRRRACGFPDGRACGGQARSRARTGRSLNRPDER